MNKKYIVRLTKQERTELVALTKNQKVSAAKRRHARILLKADQGDDGPLWADESIAKALDIHSNTVRSVRQRFVEEGLEAALHRKKQCRPSRVRKLDGAGEARLLAIACGDPPAGRCRWTFQLLADELVRLDVFESVSREAVRRALKKMR